MAASLACARSLPVLALGLSIFLCSFTIVAEAGTFLGQQPSATSAGLSAGSEHALLAELEVALGSGHRYATEKRLKRLEDIMRPMLGAVTTYENGKLGPAAAGYVLHRVFVKQHGWFIRALEPTGHAMAAWNSSSPASILEDRVPEHILSLFEKRLGERGLGLKELAILAGTLEHLVHVESLDRLRVAYLAEGLSPEDILSEQEVLNVLDTYISIYMRGHVETNLTAMTADAARSIRSSINQRVPSFPATQEFLREVYRSVAPKREYVYFNEVETLIADIGERYGRFADIECREFKSALMAIEDPGVGGAGRVRLVDFYGAALTNGMWQFSEPVDYLRQLGALDESDASNPRVIIPNWNGGKSNCVASSGYYSVCCMDECEDIMGSLEEQIAAPEASAVTITSLVSRIPSSTMPSNRTLSPWLHQRLDEVAQHHGGLVPLHGRLFAQWLHYAYPRECHFPHKAGSTNPQRPEDIRKLNDTTREDLSANKTEMERVVASYASSIRHRIPGAEVDASEESGLWSMHEELVVWRDPKAPQQFWGRSCAMLGALLALSVGLARTLVPMLRSPGKASAEKYYV